MSIDVDDDDLPTGSAPAGDRLERLYLPILLTLLALLLMVAFQTLQLWQEREALAAVKQGQESSIQEGQRLRQQLDRIAAQTARLSSEGHLVARSIVEDLRRQGVTINPAANPASP